MEKNEIFIRTAEALLAEYSRVFYIDADTDEYCCFSADRRDHSRLTEHNGNDFFGDIKCGAEKTVYEEDRRRFAEQLQKEKLIAEAKSGYMKPFEYRIVTDCGPVWHTFRLISGLEKDGKERWFILGIADTDKEVCRRLEAEQLSEQRKNFDQIAGSLASGYDVIYYIDRGNGSYYGYVISPLYGQLSVREEGIDFFAEAARNAGILVHPNDKDKVSEFLDRGSMIPLLYRKKRFSIDYRLVIDGKVQYTRATAMWSGDKKHILIGVENIDSEVQKEKEQINALNSEKELARRDELTGTRNKTAYLELIRTVQNNINNGLNYLTFAVAVCDINGLKQINDNEGHQAGDKYIRECAELICAVFAHSPVFRIGGDEFAVFIRGSDYAFKDELFEKLRSQVLLNRDIPGKPVIASGISSYDPASDNSVAEVFERADSMMYENKRQLKGETDRR